MKDSGNQTLPSAPNDPSVVKIEGPTPGPWTFLDSSEDKGCIAVTTHETEHIADIFPFGSRPGGARRSLEEHRANARLIAAAPAMLAALQFVFTDPCFELLGSVTHDEVRAAIGKAVGDRESDATGTEVA